MLLTILSPVATLFLPGSKHDTAFSPSFPNTLLLYSHVHYSFIKDLYTVKYIYSPAQKNTMSE